VVRLKSSARNLRSELMVSKGWLQGVALVMIFGFAVMGFLAAMTYTNSMPQPKQVVDEQGAVLFSGAEITAGQQTFRNTAPSSGTAAISGPTTPPTTCDAPQPSCWTPSPRPASRTRTVRSLR
jgi:hypothetical protein